MRLILNKVNQTQATLFLKIERTKKDNVLYFMCYTF